MLNSRHDLTRRRAIGTKFVGDDPLGYSVRSFQQPEPQPLGRFRIAPVLNNLIENIAILVNGTICCLASFDLYAETKYHERLEAEPMD